MNGRRAVLLVLVLMVATLSACGAGSGVVRGQVLVFSPVVPLPGSPPGPNRPTAAFATLVEAWTQGRLVASQQVRPGRTFRLVLPPASYVLRISQDVEPGHCGTPVAVRSGHTIKVDVRCTLP